jgi:hypothetical protein
MSAATDAARPDPRTRTVSRARLALPVAATQHATLWMLIACGALASIEPSPYEIFFVLALIAFGARGLLFDRMMLPLLVGLPLYCAGGLLALAPFVEVRESVTFVAISVYVSITAIFFAALVARDPLPRMRVIRSGYVVAGMVASIAAILGYFDVAGLADHFTLYNRASGTFKDPNVLGPFLAPPMVWLAQDIMLRRGRGLLRTYMPLLTMMAALLLSFSRGAWGVWAASTALMIALTFLTTTSPALRRRIVLLTVIGVAVVLLLLAIALSIPAVRDVFEIRASLSQDYDLGELGRFGAQLRSIPMLLDRPFGFGPLQFRTHFYGEDPHDVYINGFASYGWLGGLAFAALNVATIVIGWRIVFQRTPLQNEIIAVWSCLFVQILQGFQIDTDHWRHLFLLFGALYGLAAASRIRLARVDNESADAQRCASV